MATVTLALAAIGRAQVSFTDNGQQINNAVANGVALGDFNGDGHGQFTDSGQWLTGSGSAAAADVNGDGRLEVVTGTTLWLNDGAGALRDSGLNLGPAYWNWGVATGEALVEVYEVP